MPWFGEGLDDGTCGDCADGKCHGTDPDDCGCARHEASVDDPDDEDEEDEEDDGSDFASRAMRRLLDASGFTERYADGASGYFTRERAAESALGVEVESYGAGGEYGYVLAAHSITVTRGSSQILDVDAFNAQAVAEDWDGKLSAALAALGLTPTQGKPAWVLCSYYGG